MNIYTTLMYQIPFFRDTCGDVMVRDRRTKGKRCKHSKSDKIYRVGIGYICTICNDIGLSSQYDFKRYEWYEPEENS